MDRCELELDALQWCGVGGGSTLITFRWRSESGSESESSTSEEGSRVICCRCLARVLVFDLGVVPVLVRVKVRLTADVSRLAVRVAERPTVVARKL